MTVIPKQCWNDCNITVISGKFHPKKHYDQFFFSTKKKNSVRHPKMVVFRFWDRTWDPFRESKIFFSQNLTYSYRFLGWNLPGITMSLEWLHNYFVITVKSRKNGEKLGFFEFWLWSRNNVEMIATLRWSTVNFTPKNTMINFFFHKKKKKFRPTSQNGRFPILRPNLRPLLGIENFFSQNLTYLYSFLGWNLPGITMAFDSLHNYFGITVKSRKNDEKLGFFEFWLWSRNNVEMIATLRWSPVNFTPKNTMINFFFPQKKKNSVRHPKMVVFRFWDRTWDPFRESKIFFLKS